MSITKVATAAAQSIGIAATYENLVSIIMRGRSAKRADAIVAAQAAEKSRIHKTMEGRDGEQYPLHVIVLTDYEWFEHKQDVAQKKVDGTLKAIRERREASEFVVQNQHDFIAAT